MVVLALQGRHDAYPDLDRWLLTAKAAVYLEKTNMGPHSRT